MGWNQGVFTKVTNMLIERRTEAENTAELRRRYAEDICPEIAVINKALEDTASMLLGAGINGKEGLEEKIRRVEGEISQLRERKAQLLRENGLPEDYDRAGYVCPDCSDTGYIKGVMCRCKRELLALESLDSSGLGELMRTQDFDNFDPSYYSENFRQTAEEYRDSLRAWAENFCGRGNYILTGTTGLGKTHLCTAVAKAVIHRGYDTLYITAGDFHEAFGRQRFGDGFIGDGTTERFTSCDLLIIDDLGTEEVNKFTVSCLYNVINTRINKGKATLISTNLTGQELQEKYDERISSRIFGNYVPLTFSGKDIRRQKLVR